MLIPVFGTIGTVANFAADVVKRLADAAQGPHQLVKTHSGEEFMAAWKARKSDNVVLFSDSPDATLAELVLEAGIPFSVFIESGESMLSSVWEIAGADIWPARVRVLSLAVLHDLALSPQAQIITSDARVSRNHFLTRLAAHYRLEVAADKLAEIASKLVNSSQPDDAPLVIVPPLPVPADKSSTIDAHWRDRLAPVYRDFCALLEGRRVDSLSWPQEVFLTAMEDGSPGPLTEPVELTGPARTITWGPYLNLPRGRWSARATIACSRNPSGCRMGGDIYSNVVLAAWEFMLPEHGVYAFDVEFEVSEPRNALEMRFFLREGMIDGIFDLRSVDFARLP